MLKKIILLLLTKCLLPFYLARFHGIWGFRQYLKMKGTQSNILLQMYDNYFAQRGGYVGLGSNFLGEPCVPHGWYGIFISNGAVIGKNVVIFQQVTIGSNFLSGTGRGGFPVVGNNVYIGAGAKIIGGVQVGNNCRIGTNAVVYKDIPDNSVAIQSATRIIVKEKLDNRYFTFRNGKRVYFDDGKFVVVQAE